MSFPLRPLLLKCWNFQKRLISLYFLSKILSFALLLRILFIFISQTFYWGFHFCYYNFNFQEHLLWSANALFFGNIPFLAHQWNGYPYLSDNSVSFHFTFLTFDIFLLFVLSLFLPNCFSFPALVLISYFLWFLAGYQKADWKLYKSGQGLSIMGVTVGPSEWTS